MYDKVVVIGSLNYDVCLKLELGVGELPVLVLLFHCHLLSSS